jgi:hypothetical protein
MSPKEIKEWVAFLLGAFVTWGIAARRPITAADLLLKEGSKKELTTYAVEIWFSSFVLSLVFQLPVYKIIGIEWTDPTFFVPYTAVVFGMFLVTAAVIDFSLKRIGVASEFPRTFLSYSCVMAGPAPVMTLLTFHGVTDVLSPLETAKHEGLNFLDAIVYAVPVISNSVNDSVVLVVGNSAKALLFMAILGLLLQSLCRTYGQSRWVVSRALGFALGVLQPVPLIISIWFLYFVFFAFL